MFWGLVLKANRRYTQTIKKGFHVSQAALDVTSCTDEPVQVMLTSENHNYILCTLRRNKIEQVSLDLNFAEGDEISFTSQGSGNVHLSGYLIPEADDEDIDFFGEEESEDEEAESKPTKKKKNEKEVKVSTSAKKEVPDEDDEDEDDSASAMSDEDEDDGEEDEEDEDEEEDELSEEEEEITGPKPKQMKLETPKQNGLANVKAQSKEKQKKEKKDKKQKQLQQGQQQQPHEKTPKGGEKSLQGGVKIEDIRVGNGPEAKHGKKVQVYYEGRLKTNNKVFDSSKSGSGFKFGLGRGEVIKGWDIGVAGMKVGGKRRIICPPHMAYGAKGSPPVIPPNSTLVFEVELKGVN